MKLPVDFYLQPDVVQVAKSLLGKLLITKIGKQITSGIIVETEAYAGKIDKASHAYGGKLTYRTQTMYQSGGVSYVYLCYGIHHLFNVVTNGEGIPDALLIRAIEPIDGIDLMMKRRKLDSNQLKLSNGPGVLSQALGIQIHFNNYKLTGNNIWIEDTGHSISQDMIISSARVGVAYAGEHALWPYRFRIKDNKWVSNAK